MFYLNSTYIRKVIPININLIFWRPKATFYDVLNVKKDSSPKEIKDSYIKLSKLYHPDVTDNSRIAHQKFVKISEAYNTLSKPDSRKNYDWELENPRPVVNPKYYHQAYDTSMYENPIFTRYRRKTSDEDEYYGIKGIKKQANSVIVLFCICLAIVGLIVQIILVRTSFIYRKEKFKRDHEANELLLEQIRRTSELNGRELQVEILRRKFEENELERKRRS